MKLLTALTVCLLAFTKPAAAQVIITYAGNGTAATAGDGGLATAASFNNPGGAFRDGAGNVYVAEFTGNVIRKISPAGIVSHFAGNGSIGYSGDGGPATAASFHSIIDVIDDYQGNIYVVDNTNHCIRKIDTAGIITTYAGNGSAAYSGDGGPATAASLRYPSRLGKDASGNLYIADAANNRIRKVDAAGIITTVAGNGSAGFSGDGGAATAASLSSPLGVTFDGNGNMFIADKGNYRIRKVTPGGVITTYAGTGSAAATGDGGPATAAGIPYANGVAADNSCNVYFTDWSTHTVRKIRPSGTISRVVGTGAAGFSGDGGSPTAAQLNGPNNLTFDRGGNLYIPEYYNNRVRSVINLGENGGCPPAAPIAHVLAPVTTVCAGNCTYVYNKATGTVDSLLWQVSGLATISGPAADSTSICFPSAGTYTVKLKVWGLGVADSVTFTITAKPSPVPVISQSGTTLSVSGSYTSYQWYQGSTAISGATTSSYVFTGASAGYSVTVDSGGCQATSSVFNPLGITNLNQQGQQYNITGVQGGDLTISASQPLADEGRIIIYNLSGSQLIEASMAKNATQFRLPVANLPAGLYLLRITAQGMVTTLKWVK
jgi:hypothetical protein